MSRDEMEAHLRLHGWEPYVWGFCAARHADGTVVYVFDHTDGSMCTAVAKGTVLVRRKELDMWVASDRLFFAMAKRVEVERGH